MEKNINSDKKSFACPGNSKKSLSRDNLKTEIYL